MNNYTESNAFEFGNKEENKDLISNINETNYENAYLFNTEVDSGELNKDDMGELNDLEEPNNIIKENNDGREKYRIDDEETFNFDVFATGFENENLDGEQNPFTTIDSKNIIDEAKKEILTTKTEKFDSSVLEESKTELEKENVVADEKVEELPIEVESLDEEDNSFDKKTEELSNEINSPSQKIQMSDEDLTSLTTFEEDKVETTDIKSLFDRVGVNVKEASDVFKRNTEMKEKLDSRFEELKKLQLEVARKKDEQYAEINAYKDEVLNKLTEKKEEIEKRLNKLKEFQSSLEKEKEEFEQYRKKEKEEIERVQKEVQEAYDSRREELNHIEDVLRRQKDLLDEERSQLSLDKIQYESDKNELANNLLKFNEIVDSFTNGIDKLDKE